MSQSEVLVRVSSDFPSLSFDSFDLDDRALFTVLRRRAGLTQGEVGDRIGTHQSEISRWERGHAVIGDEKLEQAWRLVVGAATAAAAVGGEAGTAA